MNPLQEKEYVIGLRKMKILDQTYYKRPLHFYMIPDYVSLQIVVIKERICWKRKD
jgi:hypothetical protein